MRAVAALAWKDIRLALRDRAGFFFTFMLPIGMAVFFGFVFGGSGGGSRAMPVVVVDQDQSASSAAFVQRLERSDELQVLRLDDAAAAEDLVRRGDRAAMIVLPAGFGDGMDRIFAGQPMAIEVGVDPARKAEAGMLQGVLIRYAFEGLQDTFTNTAALRSRLLKSREALESDAAMPGNIRGALGTLFDSLDTFAVDLDAAADANRQSDAAGDGGGPGFAPIQVNTRSISAQRRGPQNAFAITFPQGIVWGLIACSLTFAVSMVLERTRGTLMRLRVAPITTWQILASKALACFIIAGAMMTLLLGLAMLPPFNVRPTSILLLVVAIASVSACFVGLMMVVAAVSKTEAAANGLGWGVFMVAAMFGGGMIPLIMLSGWMQSLSDLSPVKWSVLALEGALWRGFSPSEMAVPCAVLLTVGVIGFVAGSILARRSFES